ncbi:unnamed protein product [Caenorhabditis angaria]|uniref:Uncharacterized protein n=1 Tax=Caenorhabditis angaria TaxID=860376 RepID=A0A9P1N1G8_9PELO|nr:unnamed protein product [Caenorhabditis angaria]
MRCEHEISQLPEKKIKLVTSMKKNGRHALALNLAKVAVPFFRQNCHTLENLVEEEQYIIKFWRQKEHSTKA